jgi:hypothetical protein
MYWVSALMNVQVISLKRKNGKQLTVENMHQSDNMNLTLEAGDTFVLSGKPEALDLAEKQLVNG